MIGTIPVCKRCRNYLFDESTFKILKCKAFPNGIPEDTLAYMKPLKPPKECNNGIGFDGMTIEEQRKNREERLRKQNSE